MVLKQWSNIIIPTPQWNLTNPDTLETEMSVVGNLYKHGIWVGKGVLFIKSRCPDWRGPTGYIFVMHRSQR